MTGQHRRIVVVMSMVILASLNPATAQTYDRVDWDGSIPGDAVLAGEGGDGSALFVCVAGGWGGYHPGELGDDGVCRVAWGGREHEFDLDFLVVVSSSSADGFWEPVDGGVVPAGAYAAGADDGGAIFVCRVDAWGGLHVGKAGDDGWCYVAHDGEEHPFAGGFEVLVE